MSTGTGIQWTDATWNPVRGCSRVSEGCRNCYAERDAARKNDNPRVPGYHGFARFVMIGGRPVPQWTGRVELIESRLAEPLRRRKPQRIFVNSMSDLFHESLPDEAIDRVFAVMALCPQHTFQVLTKRAKRMSDYLAGEAYQRIAEAAMLYRFTRDFDSNYEFDAREAGLEQWPLPNVWLGVSVEDQKTADERIPLLLETPAAVRFVSYEPALELVDFQRFFGPQKMYLGLHADGTRGNNSVVWGLDRNGWLIVGGESGPGARPFDIAWARSAVAQCKAAGVACFVKQLGERPVLTGTWTKEEVAAWNPRVYPYRSEDGEVKGFEAQFVDKKGGDMDEWPEDLREREFPK